MPDHAALGVDLSNCDREPIHIPGAIQPFGIMLALRERDLTVAQASENVGLVLERSLDRVLDHPLAEILDPESAALVADALSEVTVEDRNPLHLHARGRAFTGVIHRHAGATILELEPEQGKERRPALRPALRLIQRASAVLELCNDVARAVQQLTGFERVMVYRFDPYGHGSVEAEALLPGHEPYLGLHYPASDIPQQARELYLKNWIRTIPDARYSPIRIIPLLRPDSRTPLDLSHATLRSVSPIHLEYLANMGIRASTSVSLIVHDELWGLISCAHHSGPHYLPYELRASCEMIGQLASLQIAVLEEREAAAQRAARRGTLETLIQAMRDAGPDDDVLAALVTRPKELLSLVDAGGAAVVGVGEPRACGRTPSAQVITEIADWLADRDHLEPVVFASLPAALPEVARASGVASGLLAFAIPGSPPRRLMWFRPELVQTVSWGGDPREPVELGAHARLHPRRSFALWREEVRMRARSWTPADLDAARTLQRRVIEMDLERQVARASSAVRARDEVVAVVSHDLRSPMGVIQMASSLLRSGDVADADVTIDRIDRAVGRMTTLIDDLLDLAKIEAGRFSLERRPTNLHALINETMILIEPLAGARNISIDLQLHDTSPVDIDRDRVFQVLSNLLGNAIKFTPEGGEIHVATERRGREIVVAIADTGPGIPPERLPRVFDRYWQVPELPRTGAGLGLYIAKGIVEAHGGRIWVESPPRSGAVFYFTLPIAEQPQPGAQGELHGVR